MALLNPLGVPGRHRQQHVAFAPCARSPPAREADRDHPLPSARRKGREDVRRAPPLVERTISTSPALRRLNLPAKMSS